MSRITLKLKKNTISNLNAKEMKSVSGGEGSLFDTDNSVRVTCWCYRTDDDADCQTVYCTRFK